MARVKVSHVTSATGEIGETMRKELLGIALFALVIFTLVSLLSYSPADPSIHSTAGGQHVRNLFGLLGSHSAGLLLGLVGPAAFWIPFLLLLASIRILGGKSLRHPLLALAGSVALVVASAGLLSLQAAPAGAIAIFGKRYPAGGIVGLPLTSLLTRYTNPGGAGFILLLLWMSGLLLATGLSLTALAGRATVTARAATEMLATAWIKWRERQRKARKRAQAEPEVVSREDTAPPARPTPARPAVRAPAPRQEVFAFARREGGFQLPPLDLLDEPEARPASVDAGNLQMQARLLEKKLENFGVSGRVTDVLPGPVITTFEYEPAPGVKINKIVNLSDDLALALRAISIRIVAPIPGKAVIGIEVPNADREVVRFREVVASSEFEKSKSRLSLCLGKDVVGHPVTAELDKMPHLLIAGATGAGKSVALNTMICSFLYKASPRHVQFIMVDPKRIELSLYDGIPHLITPVVTDVKKATNALFWAVREMERRYELLSRHKARNLGQYNAKAERGETDPESGQAPERLPFIVIIIDELADLMMVASRDVEHALTRLAQMARAAGIHLILATQRPSVDVLTGIIKANFPTRLSFQVSSKTDSRTILDANGAENLLGNGDMLFLPPGTAKLRRIHGAYISEAELTRITEFLKTQQPPDYNQEIVQAPPGEESATEDQPERDSRYADAVALVTRTRQASISMVQRHLRIGYNRAARIIETMEREGIVGPSDGVKPREVLVRPPEDGL
jgi:S-DNA-T family DNA segregation ATPase FtsK/SpoIIIE